MSEHDSLPGNWEQKFDRTIYDPIMNREYTRIAYTHTDQNLTLRITDVQEPNSFGGWGYFVRVNGTEPAELGLVEDLEDAKSIAFEYMEAQSSQIPSVEA
ncbi:hypothetical protein [Halopiger aswanensis]|uniref:Uncharacterized protein n=1 Tax=Halopiger aswanensis TaxID=148449 RepID=A0A419VZR0_9EURY|nr:hypothetical protein [Halopiger aswanensis]RKD88654.1 hypothetical protein ATJ93_4316 [Halopiger aswanensis]